MKAGLRVEIRGRMHNGMRVIALFFTLAAVLAVAGFAGMTVRAAQGDLLKVLKLALPDADRFTQYADLAGAKAKSSQPLDAIRGVFVGYKGDKRVGIAVWTATNAYTPNEPIHVMTGVDSTGTVQKAIVFAHKETPGWVDPINNGTFQSQFSGVEASDKLTLVVNGARTKRGDIISITNSTISAKGVAVGVSQARKLFAAGFASQ